MPAAFRLYPWDVEGDPDAAPRFAACGVRRMALAATYHAARVATPRHPLHRVLEIRTSAAYVDGPTGLPRGQWSYSAARDALETAGIEVDTWIVLGHLDGAAPELPRVVNAFGDRLSHALCLTSPESRRFVVSLADAVLPSARGGVAWLEALGWSGFGHGSLHEKTAGADFTSRQTELLGTCACDGCLAAAGLEARAETVRASMRAAFGTGDDPSWLDRLRRARQDAAARLYAEVHDLAARYDVRLRIDAADAVTGSPASVYVGCWGTAEEGRAALAASAHHQRRAAYVSILDGDPQRFASHWAQLAAAGADELHVYHAGLASDRRLDGAIAALGAFDDARSHIRASVADSR